jgi:V/A-type H+/Na+-transporting ATPase subunit C
MSQLTEYAYINARVSARAENLLSEDKLLELFHQPLGQQHLPHADLQEMINDENISLMVIEKLWLVYLMQEFAILSRGLSGAADELLRYWLRKYEVHNLKLIVRGKIQNLPADNIANQLIDLGKLSTLPVKELLQSEDVNELLRQLAAGYYSNIARKSRQVFEQQHQSYALDAAIDRYYLLGLEGRINALDSQQRQRITPLISLLMDWFNLLWLLRYRFAYQLSAAESYYLLVPSKYASIDRSLLYKLVELNSIEEVIADLPTKLQVLLAEADNIYAVEQKLNHALINLAHQVLRWEHFTVAKVMAFVLLRETEMRRVLAIVKGKRLGLKANTVLGAADLHSNMINI